MNNAGIAKLDDFIDTDPADFDRQMGINVRSMMQVSQIVSKGLIARKEPGAIVNVSSQASMVGLAGHTAYCKWTAHTLSSVPARSIEDLAHYSRLCRNPLDDLVIANVGATKGAVDNMTRVMALELGKHNIRCNAVNPTVVLTAMGRTGQYSRCSRWAMLKY